MPPNSESRVRANLCLKSTYLKLKSCLNLSYVLDESSKVSNQKSCRLVTPTGIDTHVNYFDVKCAPEIESGNGSLEVIN